MDARERKLQHSQWYDCNFIFLYEYVRKYLWYLTYSLGPFHKKKSIRNVHPLQPHMKNFMFLLSTIKSSYNLDLSWHSISMISLSLFQCFEILVNQRGCIGLEIPGHRPRCRCAKPIGWYHQGHVRPVSIPIRNRQQATESGRPSDQSLVHRCRFARSPQFSLFFIFRFLLFLLSFFTGFLWVFSSLYFVFSFCFHWFSLVFLSSLYFLCIFCFFLCFLCFYFCFFVGFN